MLVLDEIVMLLFQEELVSNDTAYATLAETAVWSRVEANCPHATPVIVLSGMAPVVIVKDPKEPCAALIVHEFSVELLIVAPVIVGDELVNVLIAVAVVLTEAPV